MLAFTQGKLARIGPQFAAVATRTQQGAVVLNNRAVFAGVEQVGGSYALAF